MDKKFFASILVGVMVVALMVGGALWWFRGGDIEEEPQETEDKKEDSLISKLRPAEERGSGEAYPDPQEDDDGDGLSNNDEAIWKTDPNNRDTDGDGYLDGEEVAAGHDPTIPAPNDKLPDETMTETADYQAEQIEQKYQDRVQASSPDKYDKLFVDRDELYKEEENLTEKYEKKYSEGEQTPETLSVFVGELGVTTYLPKPEDEDLPSSQENSSTSMAAYLRVADNRNALANNQLYAQAMADLHERNDVSGIQSMAQLVGLYREDLMSTPVPKAAVAVHKLLLAYTDALITTFNEVAMWNEDPARSLRGAKQLSALDRQYYPIIFRELEKLKDLRGQMSSQ